MLACFFRSEWDDTVDIIALVSAVQVPAAPVMSVCWLLAGSLVVAVNADQVIIMTVLLWQYYYDSIIMTRLNLVKHEIFQKWFFWCFFIWNDLSRVDLIIKVLLEFLSNL